jgi:hypothetical protein
MMSSALKILGRNGLNQIGHGDGHLVGLLTRADVIRFLTRQELESKVQ